MPYFRTIVCLANSIKHYPSRCIAGKRWEEGSGAEWIRPVCDYNVDEGAIPLTSSRLNDRTQPRVLDILQIPLEREVPHGCQVENHLIDGGVWQKQGQVGWEELETMVENHPDLWGGGDSSWNGVNDRLSRYNADRQHDSLRLIRPQDLRLVVSTTGVEFNNPKKGMRALFQMGNTQYSLKVTDPVYTDRMREYAEDVEYPLPNAILCVSLSEPWNGYHYKLVATIFNPASFGQEE